MFAPPAHVVPPGADAPGSPDAAWARNPIDAFIAAKRQAHGVVPAPEADRVTLLRRLAFDLTGLPPTPEEVAAFVADRAPDAYEKVVDRLLASPRYGERWALFWLDLVRFAESDGFKSDDLRPDAWRYRDYVIRSLNADKPFDRFVREQLAGDELYPGNADALVATGFLRHFPDEYNAVNLEQRRQEILNDITDTTAQVFLGLTLGCARCHNHKFDPILQEDYYGIQAFFAGYWPVEAPLGPAGEVERYERRLAEWETQTVELRKRLEDLEAPLRKDLAARRRQRFPPEYQALLDMPADKRTPFQQQLHAMIARQVVVPSEEIGRMMKGAVKQKWQEMAKQLTDLASSRPTPPATAMAMTDVGPAAPATYLLKRGDWRHRGAEVTPGFLSAIDESPVSVSRSPNDPRNVNTTGRRSVLAHWLTRPDHPLTARVLVNRLWQHHFGRGIVGTPSDFGEQGEPPTHPELLDWLAREFVARGWSLKAVHRLMVTSATYRQASRGDRANELFAWMPRRRLEGETLRDALLAVSGRLNLKAGGPSIYPELPAELSTVAKWPVTADPRERNRRSIFVCAKRNLRYPLFAAFDAPDRSETCARRHVSTNAPQALMLLNDQVILRNAQAFAAQLTREAGNDPDRLIDRAFRLALSRPPDAEERQLLRRFLDRGTMVDLCHALVNLNEFLYVD